MSDDLNDDRPRALITGGFGFIATWITAGLLRWGCRVTLVDNRAATGTPVDLAGLSTHPDVTLRQADITQPDAFEHMGEFEYIVHAAALLGVDAVRNAPLETLRVNMDGTAVVAKFAGRNPSLRRFLLLSSSEVYGNGTDVSEDDWLSVRTDHPRWSYAISKATAEALVCAHSTEHKLPFVIVRPFNVYGPLRTGAYAVGILGKQALAGEPITVHGAGKQSRSWCHVEDFVSGLIRCLHMPQAIGETFNIGDSRHDLSMVELAELIRDITGGASSIAHVQRTGPDIELRRPNTKKARTLLGYEPARGIEEGLRETLDWLSASSQACQVQLRRHDWPAQGAIGNTNLIYS